MDDFGGINLEELDPVKCTPTAPEVVVGRAASMDADGLCYLIAAGCEDEPFAECKNTFDQSVRMRMQMCAADSARLHLTGGDKGNRYEIAIIKEYQSNRKGKAKPKWLDELRAHVQSKYLAGDIVCIMNEHQEADDGMAQDNFKAIQMGMPSLSIIHSLDKDLTMCSGYHCDWNTYEIKQVSGFGACELVGEKVKKVKGLGTSFFWHQMLMGDTADTIPGLPTIMGQNVLRFASAAILTEMEKVETGCSPKTGKPLTGAQITKAEEKIQAFMQKGKACGAVGAYKLLADCKTDLACMSRVISLYRDYYGHGTVKLRDWKGEERTLTAGDIVVEQARLLWMRRVPGECATNFMAQVVAGKDWCDETVDTRLINPATL